MVWLDDGRAALARLEAERFDVVTLDRMLPGLDGLGLAARLRARRIQTPILMLSALGDVDERVEGLRAGGDDYLAKPFAVSELAMRVEVLLRRNRAYPEDGFLRAGAVEIDLVHRQVWGRFFEASDNLINVHIAKLRKKLERPGHPSPIQTIKGEGYRLEVV